MQPTQIKQVIAVRTDLNMRKGKMVAQGAHASVGAVLEARGYGNAKDQEALRTWLDEDYRKICVGVDSDADLLALYRAARKSGLPAFLVTDLGLTEFGGRHTRTCVAIGPAVDADVDAITGHLKLL